MYRKFALALFLLLVILSLVFALKDDREVTTSSALAYSYYQEGIVLYEQLYFREACGYFEKAVREDSNFVMALCRLSGCYHQLGFRDKGKEAWERAYSLKEQVSDREQLLLDLWQAGDGADTAATRQLAEEYLERYPDYRDGYSTLAGLEARIDNYEAAIEYYLEALAVDPGFAMAHNMLGYFNYYLGRYDDALAHLEEYSRLAPNQANPHDSRGEILHAIGRYNEAIAEFRKAFNVNPDFAYAVEHMADSYLALGKKSQIDNCFGTLIDQSPSKRKRNDFYVHWGRTLSKQQEYDSAAAMFDNVLCGDPENLNALYYLGINYYLQRDLKNVTITFDSLRVVTDLRTEKEPALKESRELKRAITLTEAMTADLSGELEESARIFAQVAEETGVPTAKAGVRYCYADVLWRLGDNDLAKSELQKNLSTNPNESQSLRLLADIFESEGDYQSALSYRERVLEIWKDADPDFKPLLQLKEKVASIIAALSQDNPRQ